MIPVRLWPWHVTIILLTKTDVLGDSLYNVIRTESGVEPGLSHYYYEIIRADTTSEATREYYKKLSIEYSSHFDPDWVK
ncbi:MAG: hypothetical protein IJ929_00585 [Prevotella sp.]|nr:hypothetical protein [Prevotella sp.]